MNPSHWLCLLLLTVAVTGSPVMADTGPAQCTRPTGRGIDTISLYSGYKYVPNNNQEYFNRPNKILVQCEAGYYSPYNTYTCQDTGSGSDWDRHIFCTSPCKKPSGRGISSVFPYPDGEDQEYYNGGKRVTVLCQTGYYPLYSTYTCQSTGNGSDWDSPVSCIEQCAAPAGAGIQSVTPDTTFYNPGQMVSVRCSAGYHPATPLTTCQRTGRNWTATVPCVKIQVTGLDITSNSISFRWDCEPDPCQEYWEFDVSCCLIQRGNKWNQCQDRKLDEVHVELYDLKPVSEYDITIYGKHSGLTRRHLQTWRNRTQEAAPDKPVIMKPTGENVIKWTLSSSRGAITGYEMNVSAQRDYNKSFTETGSYWFPPNVTQFKLEMKNGTNYTIYLWGFTSAGAGKPTQWSHETPIADPPVPLHQVLNIGVTTAELELHPAPDINGPISSYEVIISAGNGDNSSDPCAGYTSTHFNSSSSPRLYTAALIPARNLTEPTTLILGDGRHYSGFFNAPFHAGQRYSVSVRVTSAWREEIPLSIV
uniref:Uncharacterized protein n=1 Tax=Leptobrachium leishanense TaxID=445787 RepID=A0A8C5N3U8_9ANUR